MLSPLFDCPVDQIDCAESDFDGTDLAMAVKITRDYLTSQVMQPIIVVRQRNGRWKVQTNVIAFLVAHCLGVLSIPAQELVVNVERACT